MVTTLIPNGNLVETRRTQFRADERSTRISKIGIVGAGDVVRKKILPVLQYMDRSFEGVTVCDIAPKSPLNGILHHYLPIEKRDLLPLDKLEEIGFLEKDTMWMIATPSEMHVNYAAQLAGFCRVAVEKPIAEDGAGANLLLPFAKDGFEVFPMDHKLFCASALDFIDRCKKNPSTVRKIRRIEAVINESAGFAKGRRQEDTIADMLYHLFVIAAAILKTAKTEFEIAVDEVHAAKHEPDAEGKFQPAKVWTASRVVGRAHMDGTDVSYDFVQAKAAPKNEKFIRLIDKAGDLISEIDLNESGHHAHQRLIEELIKPIPDMRHTLSDAIGVMEIIDECRAAACETSSYAFGSLPDFAY